MKLSSAALSAKMVLVRAIAESTFAWEPVTPRGVAAFARASLERLIVVQSIFALIAVFVIVSLLTNGFFPAVDTAIGNLPDKGNLIRGKLNWAGDVPKVLAEGHFLAFDVDPKHDSQLRLPAQFQFEFGKDSLVIFSLLGETEIPYPPGQSFYFNRTDLRPTWGAWAPDILGLAAIGTFFGLLLAWWLLATLYFLPVWLIGFFSDRNLNFRAAWKLAGAALLPGALIMSLGLALYAFGVFDLVQLAFTFTMHLIIGWIYLLISPMFLNRVIPEEKKNPFGGKK